ncbi:MAG: hypothetical protein QNJ32_25055 [Xenococcaceae cyanobacterium MO_167.B27]|nr:hypothetical protein [Xenococcaceae cyanobacterium MO_167.B27]
MLNLSQSDRSKLKYLDSEAQAIAINHPSQSLSITQFTTEVKKP